MACPACPPFEVSTAGPRTIVKVSEPNLDYGHVQAMEEAFDALTDMPGQRELHLDLSAVEYISSCGLGKLVGLHTRMARAGGHLALTNLAPFVYELFRLTRLDSLLEVHPAEDEVVPRA